VLFSERGTFWKVYGLFENRHKITMIRVNTKEGSLLQKANFRKQWPDLKNRVFLDRNQDGLINHARSDKAP
jgi:hypothetical protein